MILSEVLVKFRIDGLTEKEKVTWRMT